MRSRNSLTRLAALAPHVAPVDLGEEDRILARILAVPRVPVARRSRRPRLALALVGIAVLSAALASLELVHGGGSATKSRHGLTGATISLAGYRFRTPAGFKDSSSSCGPSATDRFSAAASADGGCVEAFFAISTSGSAVPADAAPVEVGAYQGYLVAPDSSQRTTLYVELPVPGGADIKWQAVLLESQGLTADQLVAIAQSGLPATPSATVG